MSLKLNWIAASPPSLLYAAALLGEGKTILDAKLAAQLQPIVARTGAQLQQVGMEPNRFWANVVPWSAGLASPLATDIAEHLVAQLPASDSPLADDELALRSGPLRAAWEARGPGLWRSLQREVQQELPTATASVILVRPARGGGGEAYPQQAAVSFEALLANPHPELPEVVRLAWLLAQLPLAEQADDRERARLALIPAVLSAAADVELLTASEPTLRAALRHWHLAVDESVAAKLAAELRD
jgi:hypothetical protein